MKIIITNSYLLRTLPFRQGHKYRHLLAVFSFSVLSFRRTNLILIAVTTNEVQNCKNSQFGLREDRKYSGTCGTHVIVCCRKVFDL